MAGKKELYGSNTCFHTFSSISRDIFIVTLNKIHRYTWNFMRYKMIYFLTHKFTSKNLRFSPFYEHFRQSREKCAFKLLIKYIMIISSLNSFWWCAYLQMFFKKPTHTHTDLFKILFSLLTLSTAFLQKASGPGKNHPITANWLATGKIQYFSDNVLGQIYQLQKEFWKSVQ